MNNITKIKTLTNIKIIEKQDKNLNDYYIIFNNDTKPVSEAYFCFGVSIKHGWNEFSRNWANIKHIEIEYEETSKGNKVVNILASNQELDLFV